MTGRSYHHQRSTKKQASEASEGPFGFVRQMRAHASLPDPFHCRLLHRACVHAFPAVELVPYRTAPTTHLLKRQPLTHNLPLVAPAALSRRHASVNALWLTRCGAVSALVVSCAAAAPSSGALAGRPPVAWRGRLWLLLPGEAQCRTNAYVLAL